MKFEEIESLLIARGGNPHYVKRYIRFIEAFHGRYDGLHEKHHILPKSMFPQNKSFRNNPWNNARLSPRAHFIAHYILARCGFDEMINAFWLMAPKKGSRAYEVSRRLYREYCHRRVGEKNGFFGRKLSPEHLAKTRRTGQPVSDATRKKHSENSSGSKSAWFGKRGAETTGFGKKPWKTGMGLKSDVAAALWRDAANVYQVWSTLKPVKGSRVGSRYVAKTLGLDHTKTLQNMIEKFNDEGWNPNKDADWVAEFA